MSISLSTEDVQEMEDFSYYPIFILYIDVSASIELYPSLHPFSSRLLIVILIIIVVVVLAIIIIVEYA